MTTRDDSVSQSAPQPRVISYPNQNRSKDCANFASSQRRQADASVLYPRSQPRSHGRSGENANRDSQPCAKQKRTDSGLNWKTVQGKFFKDMDVGVDLLAPPSRCGLRADWNTMTRVM